MSQLKPSKTAENPNKPQRWLLIFSAVCLLVAVSFLFLTYQPILLEEARYLITKKTNQIKPVNKEFGIIIPKINANARIIRDVNPYVSAIYQQALSQGVAHAQGTGLPGEKANIFLFAHSSGNWYQANRYNSVFYLLYKLEKNDEIRVYFRGALHKYKVDKLTYVEVDEVSYLNRQALEETLTLMTCWPPGTTAKRLIVTAKKVR